MSGSSQIFTNLAYLASSACFILGLRGLTSPKTARKGVLLAELGMLLAVLGTLVHRDIITYNWIIAGLLIGSAIGAPISLWIPMTAVPQRTAFSHACGALAVVLVGVAEYLRHSSELDPLTMGIIGFEVVLGAMTLSGSLLAAAKLQGTIGGSPLLYKGQNFVTSFTLAGIIFTLGFLAFHPSAQVLFFALVGAGLLSGAFLVLPIGAADMPTVIAILNAFAGLAASATGFVLDNNVLIIAGALDGGSGLILSIVMCKAMNRSWFNVMFGAFGSVSSKPQAASTAHLTYRDTQVEDAALILANATSVIIIPGYGMAVSQAQHKVKELADILEKNGCEVRYAIHPVAGRMPGHMNVLLAEADVPYEKLLDMEEINGDFPSTDVALVIGANDVTNPAARTNKASPIYGMPILNVDYAKHIMVIKRGMASGFAGIENELFYNPKTMMIFGDAKNVASKLAQEVFSQAGTGE